MIAGGVPLSIFSRAKKAAKRKKAKLAKAARAARRKAKAKASLRRRSLAKVKKAAVRNYGKAKSRTTRAIKKVGRVKHVAPKRALKAIKLASIPAARKKLRAVAAATRKSVNRVKSAARTAGGSLDPRKTARKLAAIKARAHAYKKKIYTAARKITPSRTRSSKQRPVKKVASPTNGSRPANPVSDEEIDEQIAEDEEVDKMSIMDKVKDWKAEHKVPFWAIVVGVPVLIVGSIVGFIFYRKSKK
jgi:hypothetical protein